VVDLKLYGKNERQVDTLVNNVRIFRKDIGMGLECAVLIMKQGKACACEGIALPDAQVIRGLEEGNGYKYLRILKADDVKLNVGNITSAVNSSAV